MDVRVHPSPFSTLSFHILLSSREVRGSELQPGGAWCAARLDDASCGLLSSQWTSTEYAGHRRSVGATSASRGAHYATRRPHLVARIQPFVLVL